MEENDVQKIKEADEELKKVSECSSSKDWLTSLLLCWFFGFFGIHRIYTGNLFTGFLMFDETIIAAILLTMNVYLGAIAFIVVGSFVAIDFLNILFKNFKDCRGKYVEADTAVK